MKRKWFLILCTVMLTVGMMSGCGETEQTSEEAEQTETSTPTATDTPTPEEEEETVEEEAEEITMYTLKEKVPVYAENNKKSEKLAKLGVNVEVVVVAEEEKWCEVKVYDIADKKKTEGEDYLHGFIQTKFLTTDQDEAAEAEEELLKAAEEEAAAAEAAAETEAAEEEAAAAQAEEAAVVSEVSEVSEPEISEVESTRTEVSRENVDDCDGSGHGYTIITYSDGTEEIEYY